MLQFGMAAVAFEGHKIMIFKEGEEEVRKRKGEMFKSISFTKLM